MIEKDALQYLFAEAQKAVAPLRVAQEDPRAEHYLVGEQLVDVERPAPPRKHAAKSLAVIIALANRFKEAGASPVVWHDEERVVLVIDDADCQHRVEVATLTLEQSDAFKRLATLRRAPEWHEQRPFRRLLRVDLAGVSELAPIIETIKVLKWTSGASTIGVSARNRESLGRDIKHEVEVTEGALPESVEIGVPVYKTAGERESHYLFCAIENEPDRQVLQLLPMPDEIERVLQLAVESVGERLAAGLTEGLPHYYGRP